MPEVQNSIHRVKGADKERMHEQVVLTVVQLCGVHGTQIGQLVCACIVTTVCMCVQGLCVHSMCICMRRGGRVEVEGGGWRGGGVVENSITCTEQ